MTADLESHVWAWLLNATPVSTHDVCSYYGDREAALRECSVEVDAICEDLLRVALNQGFRRCGHMLYRPECPHCRCCLAYRVPVEDFAPSRSLRRVGRRNADVTTRIGEPRPTAQKETVYLRYQYQQHFEKPSPSPNNDGFDPQRKLAAMAFQMYTNPPATREMELYGPDGELLGFGNLDLAGDIVSAVYFVFDPSQRRRSLGTLAILRGIEWARRQGFTWYHLGYYLPGHPEMDYKARFRPAEVRDPRDGQWKALDDDLLAAILPPGPVAQPVPDGEA